MGIVTDEIGVACSTISRLWWQVHRACEGSLIITPGIALQNNSHANVLKYSHAEFCESLKEIPPCCHKTHHSTAKALRVSLNTVERMSLKRDVCCIHTSSLKPTLTDENKVSRMELALSFINQNDTSKFENMEDLIHIDEKWFFLMKDGQCFIIVLDEAERHLCLPALCSFSTGGYTNNNKNQLSHEKICALVTIQREYIYIGYIISLVIHPLLERSLHRAIYIYTSTYIYY